MSLWRLIGRDPPEPSHALGAPIASGLCAGMAPKALQHYGNRLAWRDVSRWRGSNAMPRAWAAEQLTA